MGANVELLNTMELCGHFLYHRRGGKRGQTKILRILSERGEMTQKEIQDILDIKSGSLSEIVRKMESDGLIERNKHASDKRNIIIRITEKGIDTASGNIERLKAQEKVLFDVLSEEEQQQLLFLLSKLLAGWKASFESSLFNHKKGKDGK